MAYVEILGEEDARKAHSKWLHVCKALTNYNNNALDALSGFVWNGFRLTAVLYHPSVEQRHAKPGNSSSEQVWPMQTSGTTFPSGPGAGIAQVSGLMVGNAAAGVYNNGILPLNSIPNTRQADITGPMHYMNLETATQSSWQGPDVYLPVRPVSSREALPYPTAGSLAILGDQTLPEWFQSSSQHEMRDNALAAERFHRYQMSATNPFGSPQMTGPISPVSVLPAFTYGFTNATPMVPSYGGVPMVYPCIPSTQPLSAAPHPMHKNDDGTPINVAQGFISIERRGVYVHNLSHDATSKELEDLFRQVGHVERCEVMKGPDKGKQCKAIVAFSSEAEARTAIDTFHEKVFMGRKLSVRLNKDPTKTQEASTATTIAGPASESAASTRVIIANGSMGDLADDPEGVPTM